MDRTSPRQGIALAMGTLIVIGIASLVLLEGRASANLPVGHLAEGMYVYEENCASCHGPYGEGDLQTPSLVGDDALMAMRSRDEVSEAIQAGTAVMHESELTRQDLADVIEYLQDLQRFWDD